MFSSIFSKVSDLLGNKTSPSQPTQNKLDDSGKNRVSFQPKPDQSPKIVKKTIKKQKTVSQEDIIASQKTQQALENASRLEAEARKKEAEIFQRLASLDEKEKYLIQKEKNLDTQSNEKTTRQIRADFRD